MSCAPESYFETKNPNSSVTRSAVRGAGVVLLAQGLSTVIRAASTIILARLLTPADVGLYAMVIAVTAPLLIFKDLGMCDAIIQAHTIRPRQVSALFWINLCIGSATCFGLVAFAPTIARFYDEPKLIGITTMLSLSFVIGSFSAQHLALLKRKMHFTGISLVNVLTTLVSSGAAVFIAWKGGGYWALVSREVLSEVVILAGAWRLCRWRPDWVLRGAGVRPFLALGAHTIVSFILKRSVRNLDRTLIGWRFGAQSVGYYHSAFEFAALPASQISEVLRNVAVSALSKLRSEPERFRRDYLKAIRVLAFIGFPISALFVVGRHDLISLLLGPKWVESARFFGILGLCAGPSVIYLTHVWLHFALGRADRLTKWSMLETTLTAAALLAGTTFGVEGVAWAYTLMIYILMVWGVWFAGQPVGLRLYDILQAITPPALAAVTAGVVAWYVLGSWITLTNHLMRLLALIACFCFGYLPLICTLLRSTAPVKDVVRILKTATSKRQPSS